MEKKYQVLARRYRPQRFSDVIGQPAVLQTLKNAVRLGAVAHAYLFSGSRGVGKTTLARLFAKTLNCSSLTPDGEPCNQCPSCQDVMSGQALDVIEIDGASNRGIDDIRQINETVGFAPSYGKYKIYIIDEVHMLTKEAFNALLKTLEEPPERAKFFFATTEPHKVLPTILSRCQRFDLGRLLPNQIIDKLERIAADLSRKVEPEALHLIARAADGSLRDAESLFDQILCFSNQETVPAADVRSVLGLVAEELFFALDRAFSQNRLAYAFELADELYRAGADFAHFLEQLIEHYRHLTVCRTLGAEKLSMPRELASRYAESAALYTQQQCFAILEQLLKVESTFQRAHSPRTALELALLQILRLKNRIPIEALVRRLSELEESLKRAGPETPEPMPEPVRYEAPAPAKPIRSAAAALAKSTPEPEPILCEAPASAEPTRSAASAPASTTPEPMPEPVRCKAPAPTEPTRSAASAPASTAHEPMPEPVRCEAPAPVEPTRSAAPAPANTAPEAMPEPARREAPAPVEPTRSAAPAPANTAHEPMPELARREAPAPVEPTRSAAPAPANTAPEAMPESVRCEAPALNPTLKEVPFNPHRLSETPTLAKAMPEPKLMRSEMPEPAEAKPAQSVAPSSSKHLSHYDTLMRFAAVELEGTFKN